uniref:ATP synthase F0 subunit 8 n=3 Tax=Antipatharia TaxID=44168 RepID=A0A0K0K665_9CNID|nr:ATP synthase F0 subunit 8 [Myriopathes japonica]YP_009750745.1 ATP synthase F0 subunit 8 [Tanacetipathes thamnea]YP_010697716.1 ATP synthase F0 subunit 8 [Myriopathes ulex]QJS34692.1 ATP synthase F0 subunit 8 [Tylopathes sp. n. NB-2020]AGN48523.1 ATP synthase F0 subunit 8 [Myriopathes japonica]QIJ98184.1 ATP synthase F0 subunit 8 [Tanacetipathes thamnea]WCF76514.1 ATP synthase F0 subunit 8 [Myriopathes ulex]
MPQLDTTTYLTQYRWTLITLFLLFSLLVSFILPIVKTNWLIRKAVMGGRPVSEKGSELNKEVVSVWKHLD